MIKKIFNKKAFTLVEMLIAVSLFIIVVTISMGAILSVFDANKKSQTSKSVVDNLNLAIENMARTVRFGSNYSCDNGTNCSGGGTKLAVTFYDKALARNKIVIYNYNTSNKTIEMSNDGESYTNITAPEAKIEYLRFYVFNTSSSDTSQPYVIVVIKGFVGERPTIQTKFSIETLMSQRKLDF